MISKMEPKDHHELSLISSFIGSTEFIQQIRETWKLELVTILPLRKISKWALEYFHDYATAPHQNIIDYLESDQSLSETDILTLRKIIDSTLEKKTPTNVDYVCAKAKEYMHKRNLLETSSKIKILTQQGDLLEAEDVITKHFAPTEDDTGLEEAFGTEETWQEAFESRSEPLFELPGALGDMMNDQFEREGFIALLGRFGSGKTFWLIELAYQAFRSRLNVAYFSVGDMSLNQVRRRLGMRIKKRSDMAKYCGKILVPIMDCVLNQKGTCKRTERTCNDCKIKCAGIPTKMHWNKAEDGYKPCSNCEHIVPSVWYRLREKVHPLTWSEAHSTAQKILYSTKGRSFKLGSFPSDNLTVRDIECILDQEETKNGFIPDVVVIDYADVLKAITPFKEKRDRIDETWKRLKGLCQQRKILVITATQADAEAYDTKIIKPRNFSDSRTKLDHVTAFYGLNKTAEDDKRGIQRINALKLREDECEITECVHVLQCLNIASPFLGSF